MNKIVIFVEGGIVQDVLSEQEIEYVIVDRDTENASLSEIVDINGEDATFSINTAESNSDAVGIIYSQLQD